MSENTAKFAYHGYTIFSDGTVVGVYGKKLKPQKRKMLYVTHVDEDGTKVKRGVSVSRILYELYHNVKLSSSQTVGFKDGDTANPHIDNLYVYKKNSEDEKDLARRKARSLTETQCNEIRTLYSNADGHCNSQWNKSPEDYSLRDLAKLYNVSVHTIQMVLARTAAE